jgi:hypothetical protein
MLASHGTVGFPPKLQAGGTTTCRLSATASSICMQLLSMSGGRLVHSEPKYASRGDYKGPT